MLQVKTPEEVLTLIRREFVPIKDREETIAVGEALGRLLAHDIQAREYVPDFDRSTVDGYACRASDTFGCSDAIPAILTVAGEVLMGQSADFELKKENCAYVPTGGAIPKGADCAVMIEYTENYGDGTVGILKSGAPAMNLIQEARNGRGKCDIFLNPRSRGLSEKAKLLEGYVHPLNGTDQIAEAVKKLR